MIENDALEEVLNEIGFGRWQALVVVAAILSGSISPSQHVGAPLLSAPVPFRCYNQGNFRDFNLSNITKARTYPSEIPEMEMVEYPSQCLPVKNLTDIKRSFPTTDLKKISTTRFVTGLPSCPEIEYDTSIFQSTVITEWHLVCENSAFRPLYQMTFPIGAILGSAFCGQMSDWIGRKRTFQLGTLMSIVSVTCSCLSPWYSVMIFMRIVTGMANSVFYYPLFTLLSEVSPSRRRTLVAMCPGFTYFTCIAAFAGLAYLVPSWRTLMLLCNSPLLVMVPLSFILDESPRWLLQKGRVTEAVDLLKKGSSMNGVTMSFSGSAKIDKLGQISQDTPSMHVAKENRDTRDANHHGTLQMLQTSFTSPGLRIIMVVLPLMWLLMRALYAGIILNANNFTSSNPFEYVAISGGMGVVGLLLSLLLSLKFTRRSFLASTLSIGGLLLLLEIAVPSAQWWLKWLLVMTAFCLVCGAFQVNYIYAAELFPTVIRTRGISYTNFIGSIGEMIIPIVTDYVVQYKSWAPSVTFGLAGIVGSLFIPLLPETMDRPMPETMQDAEDRYWYEYKGKRKDTDSKGVASVVEESSAYPA